MPQPADKAETLNATVTAATKVINKIFGDDDTADGFVLVAWAGDDLLVRQGLKDGVARTDVPAALKAAHYYVDQASGEHKAVENAQDAQLNAAIPDADTRQKLLQILDQMKASA